MIPLQTSSSKNTHTDITVESSKDWFAHILGKYNQEDKWITLDYARQFLDPLKAEATAFVRSGGEKYLIALDKKTVVRVLNSELAGASLIVRWPFYDSNANTFHDISGLRKPNVILHRTVADVENQLQMTFKAKDSVGILHIGASEGHLFQTLLLLDSDNILHFSNCVGNIAITNFRQTHKHALRQLNPKDFQPHKKHFNNGTFFNSGLYWEVDWLDTMIAQDKVILRNGQIHQ